MGGMKESVLASALKYGWIGFISQGVYLSDGAKIQGEVLGVIAQPEHQERIFDRVRKAIKRQRSMPPEEKRRRLEYLETTKAYGVIPRLIKLANSLEWLAVNEDQHAVCRECGYAFPKPSATKGRALGDPSLGACNPCIVNHSELGIRYVEDRNRTTELVRLPLALEKMGWSSFMEERAQLGAAAPSQIFEIRQILASRGFDCVLSCPPDKAWNNSVAIILWVKDVQAAVRIREEVGDVR